MTKNHENADDLIAECVQRFENTDVIFRGSHNDSKVTGHTHIDVRLTAKKDFLNASYFDYLTEKGFIFCGVSKNKEGEMYLMAFKILK